MAEPPYERQVFVNCPFDDEYRPLFDAIVFAVYDCGFAARSALEITDGSQTRIEKIERLIEDCKFGLHDISRTDADPETKLPRFNMPLELGLFLGAKRYGADRQKTKNCLIVDLEPYRYHKFISDIAGQDIKATGRPVTAIQCVRDWLSDAAAQTAKLPGGAMIAKRYQTFAEVLPTASAELGREVDKLTFIDYRAQVEEWLKANPWPPRPRRGDFFRFGEDG